MAPATAVSVIGSGTMLSPLVPGVSAIVALNSTPAGLDDETAQLCMYR